MNVSLKRAYDPPMPDDGVRILVDRLWPRGLTKQAAQIDVWLKDIAPTAELRTWFGHDPLKWPAFRDRYLAELETNPAVTKLRDLLTKEQSTLIYAAKDPEHNHALVLQYFLANQ